jgi:hypothetical protein
MNVNTRIHNNRGWVFEILPNSSSGRILNTQGNMRAHWLRDDQGNISIDKPQNLPKFLINALPKLIEKGTFN